MKNYSRSAGLLLGTVLVMSFQQPLLAQTATSAPLTGATATAAATNSSAIQTPPASKSLNKETPTTSTKAQKPALKKKKTAKAAKASAKRSSHANLPPGFNPQTPDKGPIVRKPPVAYTVKKSLKVGTTNKAATTPPQVAAAAAAPSTAAQMTPSEQNVSAPLMLPANPESSSNSSSATFQAPPKARSGRSGIEVDFAYANFTDVQSTTSAVVSAENGTNAGSINTNVGTSHLGTAGLAISYKDLPSFGLGYDAGLRFLQSFNASEYGESQVDIYTLALNGSLSFNSLLHFYLGANVSNAVFVSSPDNTNISASPNVGGQAGFGMFYRGFTARFGYDLIRTDITAQVENYSPTYTKTTVTGITQEGGFATQIGYLF
jgi:hypothetical protein